jgi:hypothetical protein
MFFVDVEDLFSDAFTRKLINESMTFSSASNKRRFRVPPSALKRLVWISLKEDGLGNVFVA